MNIQTIKRSFALATTAVVLQGVGLSGAAQAEYNYKVDRFTDIKTAHYSQSDSGCKQTKGLSGSARSCIYINSTESKIYPAIAIMKVNDSWELLNFRGIDKAPAIITLNNGKVIRTSIPAKLDTKTSRYGVFENVKLYFGETTIPVSQLKTIEVQYGSAEFKLTPNDKAICALKLASIC